MPATITLRQLYIELAERFGLGKVVPVASNTTTTFTLTTTGSPELRGPFSAAGIAIGSTVVCTVETSGTSALGNRTYVSAWNPSTGVLTVSPAIGDTDVTEIIIFKPDVGDPDRILEAINRTLQFRMWRWERRPLTFVPDGDLQGATVTDYWSAAGNGTYAYVTADIFPATSGQAMHAGLGRVLQLSSSGGSTTGESDVIDVQASTSLKTWYVMTAIRLVSGTGTVTLSMRDKTNGADIDLNVIRGSDTNTFTTSTAGTFMVCEATFQLPATCADIAVRHTLSADGMVAQMAPIVMFPVNTYSFPLPNRIRTVEDIGNFYHPYVPSNPARWEEMTFSDPITYGQYQHWFEDYGDHLTVRFNFRPHRPIFYDEAVYGSALTAMTDTTTFPLDRITQWAAFEMYDRLMRDEMTSGQRVNGVPTPSKWRPLRNAALRVAQRSRYQPPAKTVVGRRA